MFTIEVALFLGLIVSVAYVLKGITGFAEGLFMMPFFLIFLDMKEALPVALVIFFAGNLFMTYRTKKDIDRTGLKNLVLGSIAGILIGTFILSEVESGIIKSIFAIFVIIFSLKLLFFSKWRASDHIHLPEKPLGLTSGFAAGFVDALFGTGGPPIVLYLDSRKLDKYAFRATSVATFLALSSMKMGTYAAAGLMTVDIFFLGLVLLPFMVFGTAIGMKLHTDIDESRLRKFLALVLLIAGISMLF